MKNLHIFALMLISFNILGQTEQLAFLGGAISMNNSKPGLIVDGDKAYHTHPGTKTRDYSKPVYIRDSSGSGLLKPISNN